jgi:CIC family chloride channel protein
LRQGPAVGKRMSTKKKKSSRSGGISLYLLAVVVGVFAGLGAVVFRGLIALFHNAFFLRMFSFSYDANIHTPASPWGPLVILIPALGALGVSFLIKNFAPEAKGHGVPEVMEAIYYNKGIIRPVVAVVKALASALSIGSGGSVGREGPIVQIGSSFGSTLGQILRIPAWQRITLIAAGTGGGIAATFNTPIGGLLFATELTLQELSVRTLVPVAISTATATYIGQLFFGSHPSFVIPSLQTHYFRPDNPAVLFSYAGLGVLMGCVSALFIKSIYAFEDFFEKRIKGSYYVRHVAGMIPVGIMIYTVMRMQGQYYIEGVGYSTVQDVLTGSLAQVGLLLLLFLLKLTATSLTLGSGGSGGIFSPSIYLGVTAGGAYGVIMHMIFPAISPSPSAFAVAGMAGVAGGATGAAVAAIVMIFEMTLDYSVIVPMVITVAISYGVRQLLSRESIYTLKLARRGHRISEVMQRDFHHLTPVRDIMETRLVVLGASTTIEQFSRIVAEQKDVPFFLLNGSDTVAGVIDREGASLACDQSERRIALADIATKEYVTVTEDATVFDVIVAMREQGRSIALVTEGDSLASAQTVKGIITRQQLGEVMMSSVELISR